MVRRSLSPLPDRTVISLRAKSMSLTRSRRHSRIRSPLPYNSRPTRPFTPSRWASTRRTSSGVSTTGSRAGRAARMIANSSRGRSRTWWYRNRRPHRAWVWVDADRRRRDGLATPAGLEPLQLVEGRGEQVVQVTLVPGDPLVPAVAGEQLRGPLPGPPAVEQPGNCRGLALQSPDLPGQFLGPPLQLRPDRSAEPVGRLPGVT